MNKKYTLINGDCLEVMKTLADNSVDAIVTDPPYELGFMGKSWDKSGVAYKVEVWREAFRVLKFGGHLLAFGSSRTYHRLAVAIEDAGFEIRDQIQWIYGSGFPKSLDVGKSLDKLAGVQREVIGQKIRGDVQKAKQNGSTYAVDDANKNNKAIFGYGVENLTAPATDEAKQWNGFGTNLKPAHEPIVMARKPLEKGLSIAQNVLKWGTGAINIDASRIPCETIKTSRNIALDSSSGGIYGKADKPANFESHTLGRFPANLIHDGSEEVEAEFAKYGNKTSGNLDFSKHTDNGKATFWQGLNGKRQGVFGGDSGSASRFFYCAKASKSDRNEGCEDLELIDTIRYQKQGQGHLPQQTPRKEVAQQNHHPTVKPHELMKYLCRLVTPPNGTILDLFCGSGSTGKAAVKEGFNFIGIDISKEYLEIAEKRIESALNAQPLFATA